MVAVERLDHDRVADALGHADRLLGGADGLLLGHRQPGGAEQPGGEVLVGGDVDRDRAGGRRHRGADALLVDALAELDEGVLVEPDPGDVAADRLVEDGLGRRAERRALGAQDERLELRVPVEVRVGLHQVVDQAYGEPRGLDADALVDVPVDDVVAARSPLTWRVLPRRMSWPTTCCRARATCSATWPSQVPSLSRSTNPPRRPREQECSRRPGSSETRLSVKPVSVLVGKSSSEPRSTTRWIAFS